MLLGQKSRDDLNKHATDVFMRSETVNKVKLRRQFYDDLYDKFNLPVSIAEEMITFKKDIKEFSTIEVFWVMWFLDRKCLSKYFTETEIDVFGYLNFVHAKTAKKNPKSFLRLFITLAMKSDVLNEYLSANPKVKSIKYINCPACGSLILENKTCEYCELEVAQRNNPDDVRFHAGWHNLTESEKAEYNETMQQIVAMPILLQNERDIAELKLKQKFNLCD